MDPLINSTHTSDSTKSTNDVISNKIIQIKEKDFKKTPDSKITSGSSLTNRKVVGGILTGTGIAGLVGAGIAGTLVAVKVGVTGVVSALAGLVGAAAPWVAFVAIPAALVVITAIGFALLSAKPSQEANGQKDENKKEVKANDNNDTLKKEMVNKIGYGINSVPINSNINQNTIKSEEDTTNNNGGTNINSNENNNNSSNLNQINNNINNSNTNTNTNSNNIIGKPESLNEKIEGDKDVNNQTLNNETNTNLNENNNKISILDLLNRDEDILNMIKNNANNQNLKENDKINEEEKNEILEENELNKEINILNEKKKKK